MAVVIFFSGVLVAGYVLNKLGDEIEEDKEKGVKRKFWEY